MLYINIYFISTYIIYMIFINKYNIIYIWLLLLDIILKVASEKQLQDAQLIAENSLKSVPNVLFKTF